MAKKNPKQHWDELINTSLLKEEDKILAPRSYDPILLFKFEFKEKYLKTRFQDPEYNFKVFFLQPILFLGKFTAFYIKAHFSILILAWILSWFNVSGPLNLFKDSWKAVYRLITFAGSNWDYLFSLLGFT